MKSFYKQNTPHQKPKTKMNQLTEQQIKRYGELYMEISRQQHSSVEKFKETVDELKILLTNPDTGHLFIAYDKKHRHPLLCEFAHQYNYNYVTNNMFPKLKYLLESVGVLLVHNKDAYGFDWFMRLHRWSPAEFFRPIIQYTIDFGEFAVEIDRLYEKYH
jgi:hypothetical protein